MIILQGVTLEELLQKIEVLIEKMLSDKAKVTQSHTVEYMTRKEVADRLRISLPTLHDYTREGFLKAHKIGKRILYKSDEVEHAVKGEPAILTKKHKKYR